MQGYRPMGERQEKERHPVDRHRDTPQAAEALRALNKGVLERGSNCKDVPELFVDFDTPQQIPTPEEAAEMCAGCPVFDLCASYDRLASPSFGVWAGRFRGEEIL